MVSRRILIFLIIGIVVGSGIGYFTCLRINVSPYQSQIEQLTEQNTQYNTTISEKNKYISSLETNLDKLQSEVSSYENQIEELKEDNIGYKDELNTLKDEILDLNDEIISLNNLVIVLNDEKTNLENEMVILNDEITDLNNQINNLNDEITDLNLEISTLLGQIDILPRFLIMTTADQASGLEYNERDRFPEGYDDTFLIIIRLTNIDHEKNVRISGSIFIVSEGKIIDERTYEYSLTFSPEQTELHKWQGFNISELEKGAYTVIVTVTDLYNGNTRSDTTTFEIF